MQLIELILDYRAMDTLGEERTCQECNAAADEVLAAAPDMLAALRKVEALLCGVRVVTADEDSFRTNDALAIVRAAILRATGGAS